MIYVYEGCCSTKQGWVERHCRLAEYEADPSYKCQECGQPLRRVITAPRYLCNTKPFEAFKSSVDGSIITCERDLREHNKRNNVVNLHDGYDEAGVQRMIKKDYQKPLDQERRVDLASDMRESIQKLEEGYKPQPASVEEIIP